MNTIGPKLKKFRLSKRWTFQQVANLSGLDASTIWNIENSKRKPHELTVAKLEAAFPGIFEEEPVAK